MLELVLKHPLSNDTCYQDKPCSADRYPHKNLPLYSSTRRLKCNVLLCYNIAFVSCYHLIVKGNEFGGDLRSQATSNTKPARLESVD